MKKAFLVIATALSINLLAQPTMVVTQVTGGSSIVSPSANIYVATTAGGNVQLVFDIKNTSSTAKTYNVKRYDMSLHATSSATAVAYYCFGGNCYGDMTYVCPNPVTLQGNQATSQLTGSYFMLTTDLDEANTVGLSVVKYKIYNVNAVADSMMFTINYNGVNPATGLSVSEKDVNSMDIFPNPSNGDATLRISSSKSFDSKLIVFNSIGEAVITKAVSVTEGKNKIALNTDNLSAGVYFVSLQTGEKTLTRKLIIN